MMNEELYRVMFGNQRQGKKMNEALVKIAQSWTGTDNSDDWAEVIADALQGALDQLTISGTYANYVDQLMLEAFLGVDVVEEASNHHGTYYEIIPTEQANGKVVFDAVVDGIPDEELPVVVDTCEADAIVEKIISSCPPSEREKLPEDDKLAALLLSQAYWAGTLD